MKIIFKINLTKPIVIHKNVPLNIDEAPIETIVVAVVGNDFEAHKI